MQRFYLIHFHQRQGRYDNCHSHPSAIRVPSRCLCVHSVRALCEDVNLLLTVGIVTTSGDADANITLCAKPKSSCKLLIFLSRTLKFCNFHFILRSQNLRVSLLSICRTGRAGGLHLAWSLNNSKWNKGSVY